jgi:predicted transcriptional regulator with HTH domain
MRPIHYASGEEIREGDNVRYQGEIGFIEFVLVEPVGYPGMDQFLADHPGRTRTMVRDRRARTIAQ